MPDFDRGDHLMPSHRRVVLTAAALWLATGSLWADELKEKDPLLSMLDGRVAQFLEGVSLGQSRSAFSDLLAGSQLLKQTDAVKDLVARTNELETQYGKYRGFERVLARRIGSDLVLMHYLYKCENFPVVWRFAFYRAPGSQEVSGKSGSWRVVAVRFDTDLDQLQ
jgi:hypothetical protein